MILEKAEWLAATIDCDGYIGFHHKSGPVMVISMTSKEYIDEVARVTGFGAIYQVQPKEENSQLQYRWHALAAKWSLLENLCELVIPHLIIKQRQAELVMYYMREKRNTTISKSSLKMFYDTARQLNGEQFKGPGPGRPRK